MDPLVALPHELVLRILTYLDLPALTKVELLSRTWNALSKFHSRLLWAAQAQAMNDDRMRFTGLKARQVGVTDADLSAAIDQKACAMRDTWTGIGDWKEYCKRQYLIKSNLAREHPSFVSQEFKTVDAWRLRVDYEARLLIVTSVRGGLFVYDLDSSPSTPELLWSRNGEEIGPYAHLEYSKGTLATNPSVEGTIEIWRRTELIGAEKLRALGHSINDPESGRSAGARDTKQARISPGTFTRLGRLPHDNSLRGFHLRYHTLCVVSEMRRAWVWDLSTDDPTLVRELEIEEGAQGHLEQDDDVVMFTMTDGYHIFNKATGQMLGKIRYMPDLTARNFSHLNNPPRFNAWPHQRETRKKKDTPIPLDDRHISLELKPGTSSDESHLRAESLGDMASQEWGAGMLCGSIMVGVSKEGFTVIVSDWPRLLKKQVKAADVVSFIECDPQDSDREYDLGGWLSLGGTVGNHRAIWEVNDRVYLFPLPEVGKLVVSRRSEDEGRNVDVEGTSLGDRGDATRPGASLPVIAIPGTSHPDFAVPISFMALQEDHMVMTFATVADRHIDRTGMVAPIRVPEWEDEEDAETEIQSQSNSEGLEEESDYLTEEDDDDDDDPMDQWRTGRMLTGSLPLRKTVRFVYFAPWVVEKLRAR